MEEGEVECGEVRDDKIVRAQRDAVKQTLALQMRRVMTEAEALL